MAVYALCLVLLVTVVGSVQGQGDGLFYNGVMVNHGIVTREDIGISTSNAVQCQTTVADCCTTSDTNTGQWVFPAGGMVLTTTSSNIYQLKGPGYVYLHRKQGGPEGIYHCEIGPAGSEEIYYVGVYSSGNGAVTINGQIRFTLLIPATAGPPVFILSCITTGGPATTVTWTSPAGAGGTKTQIVTNQLTATYSNTLTVTGRHTGDYMCSVSNARTASPATKTLTITAASPPAGLEATLDQDSNTITVSWIPPSPPPTGYRIYWQATDGGSDFGNCSVNGGSIEQFDITGRSRDSYDITIVATSVQLPSTEVGPIGTIAVNRPTGVSATQDGTTITVSWTPPTTGATPTGYMIYYQTTGDQGSVMVNSGSATQQVITGRQEDHVYTITMVTLSDQLPSTETIAVTAIRPVAYIELNGRVLPNNSLVTLSEIGTTEATSLRCVTARTDCCSGLTTGGGDEDITEWFAPMRGRLASQLSAFKLSRTGEGDPLGYVQLYRSRRSATLSTADEGIYSCITPEPGSDPNPNVAIQCIGIYNTGGGALNITDPIQFTLDSANPLVFTLTCTSTGGPATTVTWTLDDSPISADSNHVFTQTIVNLVTATYDNTLTVTGNGELGSYKCRVDNAAPANNPVQVFHVSVPSSPILIALIANTTSALVQWSPAIEDIRLMRYEVSYERASGSDQVGCEYDHSDIITNVSSSATQYTTTGLEEFSSYIIGVVSVNALGSSIASTEVIDTLSSAPTGAPEGVKITGQDETSITVQWNEVPCLEQNSEITQYIVQYSIDVCSGVLSETVNAPTQSLTIMGVSSDTQYSIRVAAVNSAGEMGPFSDTVATVTTEASSAQSTYSATVFIGAIVGSVLGTFMLTAAVGAVIIAVFFWKRNRSYAVNATGRSIDMNECSAYGDVTVQPSSVSQEENIYEN